MKKLICFTILLLADIFAIFCSLLLAVTIKNTLNPIFGISDIHQISQYINFTHIYFITLLIFFYQGIYIKRFDFWHENFIIIKSSLLSFIIIFAILALAKNLNFSRIILTLSFMILVFIAPVFKLIIKISLYKTGFWAKNAIAINTDKNFRAEIFKNHYLGYKFSRKDYDTIFIAANGLNSDKLENLIQENILNHKEVIFTPIIRDYDISNAFIFNIFNSQTNLIMLENSLLKPINRFFKVAFDYFLCILALPFLFLIFCIIAICIKLEEPHGSIFFRQKRMGQNYKEFYCYKFRSMRENGDEIMDKYLKDNPHEIEFYEKYHKYEHDPRITKIGNFLRKSSLDELPQIINVLKTDMSIVGPRPILPGEFIIGGAKKSDEQIVLTVRPGLTGIAQINGRGDSNFQDRVKLNVWYVKNWTIYLDLVIIFKTVLMVLKMKSAG